METTSKKNNHAQRTCPICNEVSRGDRIVSHIIKEHTQHCFDSHTDEHKKWFKEYEVPFIIVYRPNNKKKMDFVACLHCNKGVSPYSKESPSSFYATHFRTCKCKETFQLYEANYNIVVKEPAQQVPTVETNSVLATLQAFMNRIKGTQDFQDMDEALEFLLESHASQTKSIDTINRNVEKQKKQMREENNRIEAEMQTRINELEHIVETLRPKPIVQSAHTVDADGLKYWDQLVFRVQNCDPDEQDLKKDYYDSDIDIETYLENNDNKPLKALYAMYRKFLNTEIEWIELVSYVEEHDYE